MKFKKKKEKRKEEAQISASVLRACVRRFPGGRECPRPEPLSARIFPAATVCWKQGGAIRAGEARPAKEMLTRHLPSSWN